MGGNILESFLSEFRFTGFDLSVFLSLASLLIFLLAMVSLLFIRSRFKGGKIETSLNSLILALLIFALSELAILFQVGFGLKLFPSFHTLLHTTSTLIIVIGFWKLYSK